MDGPAAAVDTGGDLLCSEKNGIRARRIVPDTILLFDRLSGRHPGLDAAFKKRDVVTFLSEALGNGLAY